MTDRKRWHVGDRVTYLDADVVYDAVWPDPRLVTEGLGVVLDCADGADEEDVWALDFLRALAARLPADEVWAVWRDDPRAWERQEEGFACAEYGLALTPVVTRSPAAGLAPVREWLSGHPAVYVEDLAGALHERVDPFAFCTDREPFLAHALDWERGCAYAAPRLAYPFPGIDPDDEDLPPRIREVRVHPCFTIREDFVLEPWTGKVFHVTYGALAERVELPFADLELSDSDAPWLLLDDMVARAPSRLKPVGVNMIFGAESATPTRTYDLYVTGPDRRAVADALVEEWPDEHARWRMRRGVATTTTASGPPVAVWTADGIWRGLGRIPWDDPWLQYTGPRLTDMGGDAPVLEHRNLVRNDFREPPIPFALTWQTFATPTLALHFEPELWPLQRHPVLTEPPRPARVGTDDPGLAVARAMQALHRQGRLDQADLEAALFGPAPRHFEVAFDQHLAAMPFRTLRTRGPNDDPVWLLA